MTVIQDNDYDYLGWTNRETWNVHVWITNTEPLYRLLWDHILPISKNAGDFADTLEHLLHILWDGKTPDNINLTPVNWSELSDFWWDDFQQDQTHKHIDS